LDQQYITNAEFQDAYDHVCLCWSYGRQAGRTFTLLGDSDSLPAKQSEAAKAVAGRSSTCWLASNVNETKVTRNGKL